MSQTIAVELFTTELSTFFDETFERVHGIYLDKGTSLFETLAGISAEEASRAVSASCASIAAHVEHVRFYLEVCERDLKGEEVGKIDWEQTWQLQRVTPEEWKALITRLRETYQRVLTVVRGFDAWDREDAIGNALAMVVHTAYHLGEIRRALCMVER